MFKKNCSSTFLSLWLHCIKHAIFGLYFILYIDFIQFKHIFFLILFNMLLILTFSTQQKIVLNVLSHGYTPISLIFYAREILCPWVVPLLLGRCLKFKHLRPPMNCFVSVDTSDCFMEISGCSESISLIAFSSGSVSFALGKLNNRLSSSENHWPYSGE